MKAQANLHTLAQAGALSGLYENIPNADYHAGPGIGSSDVITMGTEGFNFWQFNKSQPKQMTEDLVFGSVCHTMLESRLKNDPAILGREVKILPDEIGYRSVKYPKFCAEHPGMYCIAQDDFDLASKIIDAVLENPESAQWFQGGISEPSVYTEYPGTGLLMKCRPDYLRVKDGLSINFKTAKDATLEGFVRSCYDRAYDWQSGIYCDLLQAAFNRSFDEVHVVAEKNSEGPIRVGVYTIDNEALAFARAQYTQVISKIPMCLEADYWPAPSSAIQTVSLSQWRQKVALL